MRKTVKIDMNEFVGSFDKQSIKVIKAKMDLRLAAAEAEQTALDTELIDRYLKENRVIRNDEYDKAMQTLLDFLKFIDK